MKKDKWIWMPHAGHFILGDKCKFHLNTYVGKYIVSTVGELVKSEGSQRISASIDDKKWYDENKHLKGENWNSAYFKKFGYEKIGASGFYETMVFKARKSNHKCCPFVIDVLNEFECERYDGVELATKGHMRYCKKYARKKRSVGVKK